MTSPCCAAYALMLSLFAAYICRRFICQRRTLPRCHADTPAIAFSRCRFSPLCCFATFFMLLMPPCAMSAAIYAIILRRYGIQDRHHHVVAARITYMLLAAFRPMPATPPCCCSPLLRHAASLLDAAAFMFFFLRCRQLSLICFSLPSCCFSTLILYLPCPLRCFRAAAQHTALPFDATHITSLYLIMLRLMPDAFRHAAALMLPFDAAVATFDALFLHHNNLPRRFSPPLRFRHFAQLPLIPLPPMRCRRQAAS